MQNRLRRGFPAHSQTDRSEATMDKGTQSESANGAQGAGFLHVPSLVAFGLAVVILLVAGVASFVSVQRTTSTGEQLEEATTIAAALEKLNSDVFIAQIVQRTYAGTRDPRVLDLYITTWASVEADLQTLAQRSAGDPARESRAGVVQREVAFFGETLRTGVPPPAGNAGPTVTAATAEQVRLAGEQTRATITSTRDGELARIQADANSADAAAQRTMLITTVMTAVAVVIVVGGYFLISRQIRQRRKAEVRLAHMLADVTDLYENSACGYLTVDAAGLITAANATGAKWLGFEVGELLGTPVMSHIQQDGPALTREQFRTLAEGSDLRELEFDFVRKDGTLLPVMLNARLSAGQGKRDLRLSIFDISERRVADARIRDLNADLARRSFSVESVNKELEAFCYSVSHDLRAPLRTIDGFSKALSEDYETILDESGQHLLSRIRLATQRMGLLIDDLLGLSRVTRGEFAVEAVDLSGVARGIAEELRAQDPERNVEFVIAPGVAAVADARLMRVVLDNLLNNAWKYTGNHAQARIEFGTMQQDGEDVFFIRDDGAGFDMRYADKLFGVFQRLHNVQEFQGTGVGLATVQRIITRHGGRVWAEAAPEQGACFYFTLNAEHQLAEAA
jgi:PAS domain S-box-containing protein